MMNTTNKMQADEIYNEFKKELENIQINEENDLSMEEVVKLADMAEYDLARALFVAFSLGHARSE